MQNGGTSKKKIEDYSSSDSSDDEDSIRPLNYRTPLVTQVHLITLVTLFLSLVSHSLSISSWFDFLRASVDSSGVYATQRST